MIQFKNENYIINYEEGLENFVNEAIKITENKINYLHKLFNCTSKDIGKLEVAIFTTREQFVNYIYAITKDRKVKPNIPDWATGCFYNGGIQMLVDAKNEKDLDFHKYTPLHETVHLYIKKLYYDKFNLSRITWFDESFAVYLDGERERNSTKELKRILPKLKKISKNFDMNKLSDTNLINQYNGYDMFYVVGKYIFENGLEKELLKTLQTNPEKIKKLGLTILNEAIKYCDDYLNNLEPTINS